MFRRSPEQANPVFCGWVGIMRSPVRVPPHLLRMSVGALLRFIDNAHLRRARRKADPRRRMTVFTVRLRVRHVAAAHTPVRALIPICKGRRAVDFRAPAPGDSSTLWLRMRTQERVLLICRSVRRIVSLRYVGLRSMPPTQGPSSAAIWLLKSWRILFGRGAKQNHPGPNATCDASAYWRQ